MSDRDLYDKVHNIVLNDRSELIRSLADMENTYCLFASIYQCALSLGITTNTRPKDMIAMAQNFEKGDGTVPPKVLLDTMVSLNSSLGLEVKRIFSNPTFIPHVLDNEESLPDQEENHPETGHGKWYTHAEYFDAGGISNRRIDELYQDGWSDAMVVEIGLRSGSPQSKQDVIDKVVGVTGEIEGLRKPLVRILAKYIED